MTFYICLLSGRGSSPALPFRSLPNERVPANEMGCGGEGWERELGGGTLVGKNLNFTDYKPPSAWEVA